MSTIIRIANHVPRTDICISPGTATPRFIHISNSWLPSSQPNSRLVFIHQCLKSLLLFSIPMKQKIFPKHCKRQKNEDSERHELSVPETTVLLSRITFRPKSIAIDAAGARSKRGGSRLQRFAIKTRYRGLCWRKWRGRRRGAGTQAFIDYSRSSLVYGPRFQPLQNADATRSTPNVAADTLTHFRCQGISQGRFKDEGEKSLMKAFSWFFFLIQ